MESTSSSNFLSLFLPVSRNTAMSNSIYRNRQEKKKDKDKDRQTEADRRSNEHKHIETIVYIDTMTQMSNVFKKIFSLEKRR